MLYIELGAALFAHKGTIECLGEKIGVRGVAGVKTSAFCTTTGAAPKLSVAASIFDALFVYPKELSIYVDKNSSGNLQGIYLQYKDMRCVYDGSVVRFNKPHDELNPKYVLLPIVAYALEDTANAELRRVFTDIVERYVRDASYDKLDFLWFCDSFYYGTAKLKIRVEADYSLTDAELEAAFRSGLYSSIGSWVYSTAKSFMRPSELEKPTKKEKKTDDDSDSFMQECMDGKYILPYEWPEDMQKFIIQSNFLKTFESTPEFEEIVRKINFRGRKIIERMDMGLTGAEAIGKDALNIMLLGKPGTGKTTLAYALSAVLGMPVCTTAWNKHSEEEETEGKTKIVDGKPAFVETNSLVFHQYGGIDVNEEINLADPSVTMGALGQKLEYPYIVKKNGYETVVRHPLNVIIATLNVGTNGSNPLNQALANRFTTPYILDDPTRETFINILEKASGKEREVCEWVYKAYEQTVQYLKSPDVNEDDICQNLSIRTCLGAIENMEEGQTPVRALINSIVGAVAVVDLEVARNLQHEKIECLPNPKFKF